MTRARLHSTAVAAGVLLGSLSITVPMPVRAGLSHPAVTHVVTCGTGVTCTDGRIQKAITASVSGDTVLVYPGVYQEAVDFQGRSIHLVSADGSAVTVIDGSNNGTVVRLSSAEGRGAVLQGFTVRHGCACLSDTDLAGGGILVGGSSPTIRDNVITGNVGCAGGGGIEVSGGSPVITNNTISGNSGGGAAGCGGYLAGGGIEVFGPGQARITGNTITNNVMDAGAGIALGSAGAVLVENNVIEDNSNHGTGGSSGIELVNDLSGAMVTQNLVANNTGTGSQSSVVRVAIFGSPPAVILNNTVAATSEDYAVWIDSSSGPAALINNIVDGGAVTPLQCGATYTAKPYLSHDDLWGRHGPTGICRRLLFSGANTWVAPQFVN